MIWELSMFTVRSHYPFVSLLIAAVIWPVKGASSLHRTLSLPHIGWWPLSEPLTPLFPWVSQHLSHMRLYLMLSHLRVAWTITNDITHTVTHHRVICSCSTCSISLLRALCARGCCIRLQCTFSLMICFPLCPPLHQAKSILQNRILIHAICLGSPPLPFAPLSPFTAHWSMSLFPQPAKGTLSHLQTYYL